MHNIIQHAIKISGKLKLGTKGLRLRFPLSQMYQDMGTSFILKKINKNKQLIFLIFYMNEEQSTIRKRQKQSEHFSNKKKKTIETATRTLNR